MGHYCTPIHSCETKTKAQMKMPPPEDLETALQTLVNLLRRRRCRSSYDKVEIRRHVQMDARIGEGDNGETKQRK